MMLRFLKNMLVFLRHTANAIRGLMGGGELEEEKNEFVAIASHQLRTPISALLGYLSLLRDGSYGKLTSEQLDIINKSFKITAGMERLVNNFLNVSHAERGTLKFNFEKTDLRDIIDEVIEEHEIQAKRKDLDIKWMRPQNPVYIDADIEKLSHVFSNVIDNAIKYTEKGGISIRTLNDRRKNTVEVFVKDTGVGISPEEKEDIFKSFHRGKEARDIDPGGAGLGLHVARMIIEGHGGNMRAESLKEGEGTTFIMEIPLRLDED